MENFEQTETEIIIQKGEFNGYSSDLRKITVDGRSEV